MNLGDWQKEVKDILNKNIEATKVNLLMARCPKCKNLSLEYDIENKKIKCNKCGFEQFVKSV